MVGTDEVDTILDVCQKSHRRIALAALLNRQQTISITDLTNEIIEHERDTSPTVTTDETVTEIQTQLHHVHLPKLAETGFIKYDPEGRVIEPTPKIEREASHLSAILAVDSELPTPPHILPQSEHRITCDR